MKVIMFFVIYMMVITFCHAQNSDTKYKSVDDAVAKLGTLNSFNVATIADTITEKFSNNEQKARAIFYWIANNIALDAKAIKKNDDRNILPEKVIEFRKATPLGFSLLFQEMCSAAKIRCISVDGYLKNVAADINEKADEINHSWNVVQLGQSPETWYFVDACRASGYLDAKQTAFTKQFTSQYFFADRKLFNLAYYPDNGAWQLGGGVKNLKDFYELPVISNAAFALQMSRPAPLTGLIKTTLKKPVLFNFGIDPQTQVKDISLILGDDRKIIKPEPMNFVNNNGAIRFSYLFKKEDTYPMKIVADGKVILQYLVEVRE